MPSISSCVVSWVMQSRTVEAQTEILASAKLLKMRHLHLGTPKYFISTVNIF